MLNIRKFSFLNIKEQLETFGALEECEKKSKLFNEDQKCEGSFKSTTKRNDKSLLVVNYLHKIMLKILEILIY